MSRCESALVDRRRQRRQSYVVRRRDILRRESRPRKIDYGLHEEIVNTIEESRRFEKECFESINKLLIEEHELDLKLQQQKLRAEFETELEEAVRDATLKARQDLMSCLICTVNEKTTTLVPCGHTFCADCVLACQRQRNCCPLCRKGIGLTVRSFLSD
jgi:(p)ppGpp synthase/HD superfamily hydrolase